MPCFVHHVRSVWRFTVRAASRGSRAAIIPLVALAAAPAARADTADAKSAIVRIHSATELPYSRTLQLGIGRAMIIELPVDAQDIIITEPKTIDATVTTQRRILVSAKAAGISNLFVMGRDGRRLVVLDITVKKDMTELSRLLAELLPSSKIKLSASGEGIVMSGSAATPADASRAAEVVAQHLGGGGKVVNLLTTGAKEQVMLKVTVAELQRDAVRRLGVNLPEALLKAGNVTFAKVMANNFPVSATIATAAGFNGAGTIPTVATGTALQGSVTGSSGSVSAILESFERSGLSRTLAEPTLLAVSGESAKFHAGGEFPIPVATENNTIAVSWKQFGVNIAFTPFVLSEGRISLKVAAEVSELSTQGAVTTPVLSIPAVQTRKAETVVEMPSGSALAMAGLLSEQTRQNADGIPELKNMPVLGALFRSKDYRNNQSELVIMVTPYIVRPTDPNQLSRPDEGFLMPSPLRGLLLGHLNRVYSELPRDALKGEYGYIVEYPEAGVKD
jgi:pilus assembly protein CpaC